MTDLSLIGGASLPSVQQGGASAATVALECGSLASDYIELLKPRVMSLVVFTGLVGLWIAPVTLHPLIAFTALLCIAIGAGAAGAVNMWYDRDIDARMRRTSGRPIPTGRVDADEAAAFGVVLSVGSVMLMGLAVNWTAAVLLAAANSFYVLVYTIWLKRRTAQNIVIGGAAGAFPPVIGWAAATGDVGLMPIVLFLIIFLWTPPHFWALALLRRDDYAAAGVPMLPLVAGERATGRAIFIYALLVFPVSLVPGFLGAGPFYTTGAAILSGLFVVAAWRVMRDPGSSDSARQMFGYSILYLFLVFTLLIADRLTMTLFHAASV